MFPSPTTASDLAELELRLGREEKDLQVLKDSLETTDALSRQMISILDGFDGRLSKLDARVMPISRNMQVFSQIYNNIASTLGVVQMLQGFNQLALKEENIILLGPQPDSVGEYLDSLGRLNDAIDRLDEEHLQFCTQTKGRLDALLSKGFDLGLRRFKEWLETCSMQEEDGLLLNLKLLAGISSMGATEDPYRRTMSIYVDVRAAHLGESTNQMLRMLDDTRGRSAAAAAAAGGYKRGSHAYIQAIQLVIRMLGEEEQLATQILPAVAVKDVLRQTGRPACEAVREASEGLVRRLRSGGGKAASSFVEGVVIFDLLESFNDAYYYQGLKNAQFLEMLALSLRAITGCAASFLQDLMENVRTTSTTTTTTSYSIPANATVFEQTSVVLNCLKRMLDYERSVESLLGKMSQPGWDGILGPIPRETQAFAMSHYYQEILRGLEASIEGRVSAYRKPMVQLIFLINNYQYFLKTFKSSALFSSMLTQEAEPRYEEMLRRLVQRYLDGWSSLVAGSIGSSDGRLGPKDRLKLFASEMEDTCKLQAACTVPDAELKGTLKRRIKEIVLPAFTSFYSQNASVFASFQTRSGKYDAEEVEGMIDSILDA